MRSAAELRVLEDIRTCDHEYLVETTRLDYRTVCARAICLEPSACLVNDIHLCEAHAAAYIGRLLWDARIAALIDLVRVGGFELLGEEAS
jgi:hypothetical protein